MERWMLKRQSQVSFGWLCEGVFTVTLPLDFIAVFCLSFILPNSRDFFMFLVGKVASVIFMKHTLFPPSAQSV